MPGTPADFIRRVLRFKSWSKLSVTYDDIIKDVNQYLNLWGVSDSSLDKEWSVLSGGEAQRVILAFTMASEPKVLLLDESTSALDLKSKIAVERSIMQYTNEFGAFTLLVSHDEEQADRLV
jgi:ABC-type Fe3+/spermidine/putrescine transport system ATPase subunit